MAREKGMGNLQLEKSGRWTVRISINGRRISRSTGTRDRAKAERFLDRMLTPLGLGRDSLPLAEAWQRYEMSPKRRDIAPTTLASKRLVWMAFARWTELNHPEITNLSDVSDTAVAEYLAQFRCSHSATTYNNHVCNMREIFRVLADIANLPEDPWAEVRLRADDSVSRRELSIDEVSRLIAAAAGKGPEWRLLFMIGIYTGLRLGDCCRLSWDSIDLEQGVIQLIPSKTRRHAHGKVVTIPIHQSLRKALEERTPGPFLLPGIAEMYYAKRWRVDEILRDIFADSGISMNTRIPGRRHRAVIASFHSLRHTFVSISANAGVPLSVVQSIVGHCSPSMTRHYYHESIAALRRAVSAIPAL